MGPNEGERGGETRVEILKNSINYGILYLVSVYRVRKFQISFNGALLVIFSQILHSCRTVSSLGFEVVIFQDLIPRKIY